MHSTGRQVQMALEAAGGAVAGGAVPCCLGAWGQVAQEAEAAPRKRKRRGPGPAAAADAKEKGRRR